MTRQDVNKIIWVGLFALAVGVILMIFCGDATGQTIEHFTIDSSTSATYAPIGIPRDQILPMKDNKRLVIGGGNNGIMGVDLRLTTNLDVPFASRFVHRYDPIGPSDYMYDHAHMSVYNDTIYIGNSYRDSSVIFDATTDSLTRIKYKLWPPEFNVVSTWRLPNSDTCITLARGNGDVADTMNVHFLISADKGMTYGSAQRLVSWGSVANRVRMHEFEFNGTIAAVLDSGDYKLVWLTYNRTTHAFDRETNAIFNRTMNRTFTANCVGNIQFAANSQSGQSTTDSILYAWKYAYETSWHEGKFAAGGLSGTYLQQTASTVNENDGRLTLFFTRYDGTVSVDSINIYATYCYPPNFTWSTPVKVSRGRASNAIVTAFHIPAAHGNVAYLAYPFDSTIGVTTWHYADLLRITYGCSNSGYNYLITSLPFYVTTTYNNSIIGIDCNVDSAALVSTGDGIIFNSGTHDIVIDGRGRTISWGKNATTHNNGGIGDCGIRMDGTQGSGLIYNIEIKDLNMEHIPTAIDNEHALFSVAAFISDAHDIKIHGIKSTVRGKNVRSVMVNSYGTSGVPYSYDVDIYGCTWRDSVYSFSRRDLWTQQTNMNFLGCDYTNAQMQYHFSLHSCTLLSNWSGVYINGDSTVASVYDNYILTDSRNEQYNDAVYLAAHPDYATSDTLQYCTGTECYAIALHDDRLGSDNEGCKIRIVDNTIRSGTANWGGRGIFGTSVNGQNFNDSTACIFIAHNDIDVHQGFDGYASTLIGLISREGCRDWYVKDNRINIVLDSGRTTADSASYGSGPGHGLRYSADNPSGEERNMKFFNNHVTQWDSGGLSYSYPTYKSYGAALALDAVGLDRVNIFIDSNYFGSNNIVAIWGFINGEGGNLTFKADTFAFIGAGNDIETFRLSRATSFSQSRPKIVDPIFEGGTAYIDIDLDATTSHAQDIAFAATLDITVIDSAGNPVPGAYVFCVNNYGDTAMRDTSDASGKAGKPVNYYRKGHNFTPSTDSTAFNNMTVGARYASYSADSIMTVDDAHRTKILAFGTYNPPEPPADSVKHKFYKRVRE